MSLLEVLCWLREELPLARRQAPKRVLVEHYLAQEHAVLQLPSAAEAASDSAPGHGRLSQAEGSDGRCSPQEEELSSVVDEMFRKARLKRCFQRAPRRQQNGDDSGEAISAASPPGLVLQRPPGVGSGVGDLDARAEQIIPIEQAGPPPQLEELHPSRHAEDVVEPRSPQNSEPAVDPPPPLEEAEDEAEQARRRILPRRFFQAARHRGSVGRNDRLDLGQGGTPASAGGAPCFTVGGSLSSSVESARLEGQHGPGDVHAGVLRDGNGEARLRRANLLRRILHALRESTRERVLAAAASTAPPSPASQDQGARQPLLPTPHPLRVQNEPPPVPVGPLLPPTTSPQRHSPAGTSAAGRDLPVHPRRARRTEQAYQAVFKALAALLPSCPIGEVSNGSGCRAGAAGGVGRMHAAAMRCGVQCQGYIRALQKGLEVIRSGPTGEDTRSKLVLQAASADGAGVALALRDIDVSAQATPSAGVRGNVAPSPPSKAPASVLLPLARITRVRCLAGSTGGDESLGFVVLAAGALGEAKAASEARSNGSVHPLAAEEVAPFGVLRATSGEEFHALVLGVASVKSALDSPFRTRKLPNLGTRAPQPTADPPPSESPLSGPPETPSSPAAAAISSATTAAACLPWQGARVCIVELAPSLTFLGAVRAVEAEARRVGLVLGAVRAVEAEARRVGKENGLTLRDQKLLLCADLE